MDWMSNVERLSIKDETVDILLNKFQRHRGDTLNSGKTLLALPTWGA